MPKLKSHEPYTQWKVHIDASIAARVELHLFDAIRGKPKYGSRHALIESLLTRWLDEVEGTDAIGGKHA